ncbi:glycerol-3-phosphate O-acyltransferase/dihydroxyacetone phosphate acyltransferase [Cryptococcus wingfieldii CBS 7118]|uniref:Glycerol-3-phosphate O-acyltransferase/dihydroxyacetone phosphate acyltransferase n=1 Tax=Cryptococcus wingfieldii CBS 7118 TaxID=1295528 RepID=A0A1E3K2H9_9TREE|nr:glycerol-3-phosphate O-acyltransferase/dihydroxyacetone phosphate acyltransferase [Cryptococcus wingfieldii CBS 7118]ODO07219.1 glycerol-3-phosphate O-acyltransferase/dihydroxyacetone phosphate acyltransferase [Cryptococcus wingfieldii CBS 7118]
MPAGFAYDFLLLFWRIIINIFFREIRPRGAFNIPQEGPVLFICGPHANQFLDPLLLFSEVRKESGRRVSILTAAKSMNRKFIGAVARVFDSIPVARAADYATAGKGRIVLSESDPLIVTGLNTDFTTQVKPHSQLVLPKSAGYAAATVGEVISDTEIRLRTEFVVPSKDGNANVKASTRVRTEGEQKEGLEYKVLPHVEQEDTYGACFQRLNEGGCIGVFPEGGSHDRTDFLPLKAGFSIMALGAKALHPDLDVKLVPVGLSYFHPHKFRSRAVVEFGPPISVDPELVELYKQGGAKKREACGKLLEQVHDGLRAVTLRAPDWETMQVIQAARRLYRIPGQHLTLGQVVELSKRMMEGYLVYKDEPKIIDLRQKVLAYNRLLRDMGIADHQVERASNKSVKSLLLLIYRTGLLIWWSLLALPGTILHAPVFILAKLISIQKAKEALAASTVKIQGRDVLATWKILVSLAVTPLLYIFYSILATYLAYKYDLAPAYRHWTPVVIFCWLPGWAMASLKFGEAGMDVAKSLRPLFLSVWPGNQREADKLREMRESLTEEISEVIDEFGPELYDNFQRGRILPSASVPQTGRNPGLLSRKSQSADSSVLSHPMLWLDERIFGWNRSASIGQSVWSSGRMEKTRSEMEAEPLSPTDSDGEEYEADVDYDDVLAIIDTKRSTGDDAASPSERRRRYTGGSRSEGSAASPRSDTSGMPLPKVDDEGVLRLHKRPGVAAKGDVDEDQGEQGLGLDTGKGKAGKSE